MSVSIVTIAFFLLIGRLVSVSFIVSVLRKQWHLMRLPIDPSLRKFRRVLFFLSCAIFLGNMVPIVIDTATLFVETSRPAQVKPLSVGYAMSNMLTSVASSYLIWLLYRLANQPPNDTQTGE